MTRCVICDWSPSADSLFLDGLTVGFEGMSRRLVFDRLSNGYICSDCYSESCTLPPPWVDETEEEGEIPLLDLEFDEDDEAV